MRISLDAMGGDRGPETVLAGAELSLSRRPELWFELYGESERIAPLLNQFPLLQDRSALRDCAVSISMDEKPSQAVKRGRRESGMWKAIEAVKSGEADCCVSAGNTGALMAMSKLCLRTLSGVKRPAMAALWPTLNGESVVLDVGANVGADARQLVEFAVMGAAMARALYGMERPAAGLLNIGVEEIKGQEEVREAGRLLRENELPHLNYHGFVEGDDLGKGAVDVVVTEGFSGNIALKTAEGTARQIAEYMRLAMNRSWSSRIGYWFARGAFDYLRNKMDTRKISGAVFLGLNGLVVKSHGGSDSEGMAGAIEIGRSMAAGGIISKIERELVYFSGEGGIGSVDEDSQAEASGGGGIRSSGGGGVDSDGSGGVDVDSGADSNGSRSGGGRVDSDGSRGSAGSIRSEEGLQ